MAAMVMATLVMGALLIAALVLAALVLATVPLTATAAGRVLGLTSAETVHATRRTTAGTAAGQQSHDECEGHQEAEQHERISPDNP